MLSLPIIRPQPHVSSLHPPTIPHLTPDQQLVAFHWRQHDDRRRRVKLNEAIIIAKPQS